MTAYHRKTGPKQPKKLSKKPYKGVLLEPIQKPAAEILRTLAAKQPDTISGLAMLGQDWINSQIVERLAALAEHYAIGPKGTFEQRTFKLLMHVAHDFVPGFQFQNEQTPDRRGKRTTDKTTGGLDLLVAVENCLSKNKDNKPTDAFRFLVDRKSNSRWVGKSIGALERAFNRTLAHIRKDGSEFNQHPLYSDAQKYVEDYQRTMPSSETE